MHPTKKWTFYLLLFFVISILTAGLITSSLAPSRFNLHSNTPTPQTPDSTQTTQTDRIIWQYRGEHWRTNHQPPTCDESMKLTTPVDLDKVTSILYPGQTRGGDYKPHGGFRFDDSQTNAITVSSPLNGYVTRASRYLQNGQLQYLVEIQHPCGIMVRFDHLLSLSPTLQPLNQILPDSRSNDSRTTDLAEPIPISQGDLLADKVGFTDPPNIFVDFGVYDLRQPNYSSQDTSWAASRSGELANHGVCWLDFLASPDKELIQSLPAGDTISGDTSDYCLSL